MNERANQRILSGPLAWEVARFGTPLALGMGLQTTFNLVDAYLIARLGPEESSAALGAIGICDQLGALGSIISYGISIASAAVVSRRHGEGDVRGMRHAAFQSLLLVLGLGCVFALVGCFGGDWLMREVMSAKGDVARLGAEYLRVQIGGSVTIFLLLHLTTLQRALGSSKTPVALLVLANALNVLLAILMVYGPGPAPAALSWGPRLAELLHIPRMGLMGAAWSTVLARLLVLAPITVIVMRRFQLFRRDSRRRPDRHALAQLWSLGWPSGAQLVVRIVGMLIVHRLVAQGFTTETDQSATTALGIVFRLETMALFVSLGWGSAAQTFVGQNLGAGHVGRAQDSGWWAAVYDSAMMLGLGLLYRTLGRDVIAFFDPTASVVAVGLSYVDLVSFAYVGLGAGIALGSAIQGAGATRVTLRIDALIVLGLQLPLSVAVVLWGGSLQQLWTVTALTYLAFALAYAPIYKRGAFLRTAL